MYRKILDVIEENDYDNFRKVNKHTDSRHGSDGARFVRPVQYTKPPHTHLHTFTLPHSARTWASWRSC